MLSNPSWIKFPASSTTVKNITALSVRFGRHGLERAAPLIKRAQDQITYSTRTRGNITVLAAKTPTSVNGLLYVPDLPAGDPCVKQAAPYVPSKSVRRSNLPPTNYNLVAIAPWISSTCSKKYITSADSDPIRALIFYRPNNSSTEPPAATSAVWDINGSTKWRAQRLYPVFAVPGMVGQEMMRQLSLYSGNVTEVPFAQNISELYDPSADDYVRIWTDMDVSTPPPLLGIWVYLLIVIAVLVAIISATSLTMHLAQAGRRISLRRRVVSGEVNLEGMGIKRLTVPMDEIHRFPLYTYRYEPPSTSPPTSPKSPRSSRPSGRIRATEHGQPSLGDISEEALFSPETVTPEKPPESPPGASSIATDSQPLCCICLSPYQNRVTVIREVRCGHIFHPDW